MKEELVVCVGECVIHSYIPSFKVQTHQAKFHCAEPRGFFSSFIVIKISVLHTPINQVSPIHVRKKSVIVCVRDYVCWCVSQHEEKQVHKEVEPTPSNLPEVIADEC